MSVSSLLLRTDAPGENQQGNKICANIWRFGENVLTKTPFAARHHPRSPTSAGVTVRGAATGVLIIQSFAFVFGRPRKAWTT
eukprot:260785-Rhodomonas_salina.4